MLDGVGSTVYGERFDELEMTVGNMATEDPPVRVRRRRRIANHKSEPVQADSSHLWHGGGGGGGEGGHKKFVPRESTLTVLLAESAHIRAIYNIFVAILVMLLLNTIIYDFVESGKINVGWETVKAGFGEPGRAAKLWFFELAVALAAYPALRLFAAGHSFVEKSAVLRTTWRAVWLAVLVALQGTLVIVPVRALAERHLAIASAATVVCELFRFMMKIHAFVWAVAPRVMLPPRSAHSPSPPQRLPLPTFRHYVYFLFVPTLLYRDEYPRTKLIRWSVVVTHFGEVAAVIFYNSFLWERFILPYWSDFGKTDRVEAGQLVRAMFACVLPGLLSFLCGFYCILHAWFNAFAEMLTFADRLFYEDWWTTSRFSTFYRSWNRVVHAWLLEHVHSPLVPRLGRGAASVAVFLLSAVAHELILALSYGFFYPVLTVMFVSSGLFFVPLTSHLGRRYTHAFNFIIWLGFFIGNGLLWSLYPMEYFARRNCPVTEQDSYLVPKSWSCPTVTLKPNWHFQNPLNFLA